MNIFQIFYLEEQIAGLDDGFIPVYNQPYLMALRQAKNRQDREAFGKAAQGMHAEFGMDRLMAFYMDGRFDAD
ncbi:hypothetical protein [Bergeriella denitrificans]|uniref:Uncharacterized protein n=2 Tax=Bergeriella denitrificans TaxID=494 RepID=A0A378UD76_BERDE|nr:hypothetical protein [Bergeriella denitrificans]STZ75326.1 Uncharacterised protein [Bergeriella denitrificans]